MHVFPLCNQRHWSSLSGAAFGETDHFNCLYLIKDSGSILQNSNLDLILSSTATKFTLKMLLYFFVISIPKYVNFSEVTLNGMCSSTPGFLQRKGMSSLLLQFILSYPEKEPNSSIVSNKVGIEICGLIKYIKMSSTYSDILFKV